MGAPASRHDHASSGPEASETPEDALPVLAEEARVVHVEMVSGEVLPTHQGTTLPAVQAAAAAAGGFVAGVAVVGLVTRRRRRSSALARGRRAGRGLARGTRGGRGGAGELVQIVGSRSLLLDVHLLGGRD